MSMGKPVWELIQSSLKVNADKQISDVQETFTYTQLLARAEKKGMKLLEILPPKAKCGILCERELHTAITLLACFYANMVPVVLSKNYGDAHCEKILALTKPSIIITDTLNVSPVRQSTIPVFFLPSGELSGQIQAAASEEVLHDVCLIMCTSGTTGTPKGAMITERGLVANVCAIAEYFAVANGDKILISRPLYHCAALTGEFLLALHKGLDIRFFDQVSNPFSILKELADHRVSVICGTPTQFFHLSQLAIRQNKPAPLEIIALSGECLTGTVAKQIRQGFPSAKIYHAYGLTECGPRVSYLPPHFFDEFPESVGIPLIGVNVEIVDDNGTPTPKNTDGHLLVQGPSVMKGYYRNETASAMVLRDGFLRTGDIACFDDNGLLFIKGRADDMIIKAGMNIYPREIENALKTDHRIRDAAAYRIITDVSHQIGVNLVLDDEYKSLNKKKVMEICTQRLPSYQMPREINIVDKLERNASGKIVRKTMLKHETQLRKVLSSIECFTQLTDSLDVDTPFQSAGLDSLNFVRMIIEIENEFGIAFPEDKMAMAEAGTIQQLCDIVESQIQRGQT